MKKIVFLFVLTCLVACKSKIDYTAEIKQTDSLQNEIKGIGKSFYAIDSVRMAQASEIISAYLDFITKTLKDTISREEAQLLSEFKNIKKSFGKFAKAKKQVNRYYSFNLKQLENLGHDMKEGLIESKDSALRYLSLETTANTNIIGIMKLNTSVIPMELNRYDSLRPRVEEFIKKLNQGTVPPDLLNAGLVKKENE